ncbi:MAG: hypothetical protein RIF41_14670 [Polyangiaceae bacterium]
MNPFFFGSSDDPLFGIYHPPQEGRGKNRGVVICNPFGDEAIKAHRALRQLAMTLSEARMHALRFDYYGSGDSAGEGELGRLARWVADVGDAADELKDTSGVAKVSFTGLRLGASLALLAASGRRDLDRVALWDPIVNGRAYLDDLQRIHEIYLAAEFPPTGPPLDRAGFTPHEIMGFPLPPELRAELEALDLTTQELKKVRRVTLVVSTKSPQYDALADHLTAQGAEVSVEHVPVGVNWNSDETMETSLVPTEAIDAVTAALTPRGS